MQVIDDLVYELQHDREALKPMLSALDVTAGLALEGEEEPYLELGELLRHVRPHLFEYFDRSAHLARLAYRHRIPGACEEAEHLLEDHCERRRWLERAFGEHALRMHGPAELARKSRLLVEWARMEMQAEERLWMRTRRWQAEQERGPAASRPPRTARESARSSRSLVASEPHLPEGRANEIVAQAFATTATAAALGAAVQRARRFPHGQ